MIAYITNLTAQYIYYKDITIKMGNQAKLTYQFELCFFCDGEGKQKGLMFGKNNCKECFGKGQRISIEQPQPHGSFSDS